MTMGQNGGNEGTGTSDKDLQDRASHVADEATRTVEHRATDVMSQASDTLSQVANAFRQVGDELRQDQPQLASLADTAATRVDDASSYLRQHDANDVLSVVQDTARRQPAIAIGGGLLLGFALARILRSSEPMSSTSGGQGGDQRWSGSDYGVSAGYRSASGYGSGAGYGSGTGYGSSGYGSGSYAGGATGYEAGYQAGYQGSGSAGGAGYAGEAPTAGGYGTSDTMTGDADALVDPTIVEEIDVVETDGGSTYEG